MTQPLSSKGKKVEPDLHGVPKAIGPYGQPTPPCKRCNGERYIEKPPRGFGHVFVPCPECNDIYGKHLRRVTKENR